MKVAAAIVIAMFLVSTLNVAFIAPAAASDSGLVGYWSFNEGSGSVAHDSSGNGNDGTLKNFATNPWATGRIGGGLAFDGYGYVDVGNQPELKPTTALTVEAWVKYDVLFSDTKGHAIISQGEYYESTGFMIYQSTGYPYNRVQFFICTTNGKYIGFSSATLSEGTWYHLAMTYDGSKLRLYINGDLDKELSVTGLIDWYPNYNLLLGSTYTAEGAKFKGILDEVRIWNQARVPVKFIQTGLDGTAKGTVVTVTDTLALEYGQLPHLVWVTAGSTIYYDYEAIVESTEAGKYFALTSVNPIEPSTVVSAPITVTGTYIVQHYPNANAGGPYAGTERSPITFDASDSTDPDGDTLKYRWDFDNDGTWDTEYSTDATAQYTWYDDYSGQVKVGVSDGFVETTAITTVTVNNVDPSINAVSDTTINEGDTYTASGSFTDPGADTWTATVDYGDGSGTQTLTLSDKTFSLSHTYTDNGEYKVTVTVTDDDGGTVSKTATVQVINLAPKVDAGSDVSVDEGSPVSFPGSYSDPGVNDSPWTIEWDFGDGAKASGTLTPTHTYTDSGVYTVTLTVTDKDDGVGTDTLTVTVNNVAPTITIVTCPLDPIKIGTPVDFTVQWSDPGLMDTQTIVWSWGDDSSTSINIGIGGDGSSTTQHTYLYPGVYVVSVTVTDKDGGSDTKACEYYIVVYDPNAGFVTGGGWIWSPAGAYAADPTLTGKATFGFVSKYQKGATVPTGNTEFQFHAAGLNFKSTSYQWLVIAGTKAMYKGSGTINGEGSYGFLLSAIDGGTKGADMFRIKIWNAETGDVVYDNMLGATETDDSTTVIAGGSIVVHSK
ncbi:MAG: PKD domain-containing protein [Candidatus Bathyarchaeota archaeon]|nr:PKD domain-containing protein [Candidatus Bathyarchaeota archaeon]